MQPKLFLSLLLLLLAALACGLEEQTPFNPTPGLTIEAPTPTLAATASLPPIVASSTVATALVPTATATSLPVLTVTSPPATAVSPPPTTATPIPPVDIGPAPATFAELAAWLAAGWQQNYAPDQVQVALQAAGWQRLPEDWKIVDLDGDGRAEWLATLYLPETRQPDYQPWPWGLPGDFWIVGSQGILYRYSTLNEVDFGSAPQLLYEADMSGDGRPEAVIRSSSCGASTCFNNYLILSAHFGPVANLVQPGDVLPPGFEPAISMSFDESRLQDWDGDSYPDLVLHGGTAGSVGAGPQRARTEVWSWNGQAVALVDLIWDQSNLLLHVLYDGNFAYDAGDVTKAIAAYKRIFDDPILEDVQWVQPPEEIRADIEQFAAFRLVLMYLLHNERDKAIIWQNWLLQNYPDRPLSLASLTLVTVWDNTGSLPAACAAVTDQLLLTDNPTGSLVDIGYANPSLTAEDVCIARWG